VFIWWWFVLVGLATISNVIYWLGIMFNHRARFMYVMRYLRVSDSVSPTGDDRFLVESFVQVRPSSFTQLTRLHRAPFDPTVCSCCAC
jgi:hypothetical protein